MPLKLYVVYGGPPSVASMMCLKALKIEHELIPIDWFKNEHKTEDYAKLNPQKEIPVLNDDGFLLSESNAILQYLCDKYAKDDKLYPKDPKARALVNHRLCFNLSSYYSSVGQYLFLEKNEASLSKMKVNLDIFSEYLKRLGTKYAAGDNVTIADFQLVTATMCLEAASFDISLWHLVQEWYNNFKMENPDLWAIAQQGVDVLQKYFTSQKEESK